MDSDSSQDHDGDDYIANPAAATADLSKIRGLASENKNNEDVSSETDLENLAELVPGIKDKRRVGSHEFDEVVVKDGRQRMDYPSMLHDSGHLLFDESANNDRTGRSDDVYEIKEIRKQKAVPESHKAARSREMKIVAQKQQKQQQQQPTKPPSATRNVSAVTAHHGMNPPGLSSSDSAAKDESYGDLDDYPDSDQIAGEGIEVQDEEEADVPQEFMNMSSGQSISTATQTHEVRMPMYLPTFKPATGCTNASDFIVRCFVARLRSGITVVKHGRSRWCKSRLRVLHIHPDGRSLSWKPAEGEPPTSKRPPKLDLSICSEVRHAWSPDPLSPMYTGTPILRQKCEAANAHKSFALIFKSRTVDITAVTADQCKVLMEGFSALCFRLQVANLSRSGASKKGANQQARPMPEEDGVSTTASATLTNRSTPRGGGS
ncbi:hypothetical protein MPSEU_000858200 [Mayamaea pseudoterrestris]|nr:hypothetical protein MPSEU_000858200 [Mayamaea pseudoterrestris]